MSSTGRMLVRAQGLIDRGFSVIPIHAPSRTCNGKSPAIPSWRRYQHHRPTADDLRRWFATTPMNVAVVTGAVSGVVVVDVDSTEALRWATRRLPYTPWQIQTGHGYHLYYAHPGVPIRNRVRINTGDGRVAADVRGDGAFVVAAGLHANGREYREAGDWSVARDRLPLFAPDWIEPVPRAVAAPLTDIGSSRSRAERYLDVVPRPEIGRGSDHETFVMACRLVNDLGLSPEETVRLLWTRWGGRPGWTIDWIETKVANAVRYSAARRSR